MKILTEKEQMPVIPEREGYVAVEKKVNAVALNVVAAVIGFPLTALAIAAHILMWKEELVESFTSPMMWVYSGVALIVALIAMMFVFELLHGIALCLMAGLPLGRMRFGFAGDGLVFQCRIDGELITKRAFVRGLIIPDLIFALVPLVLGLCLNCIVATIIGSIVLMCTVGDIMIVNKVRGEHSDTLVYMHPNQAGCFVYHKDDE